MSMGLINIFEVVVRSSLIGSLIVVLTLIVKGGFRNKLNPIFHYYVWIILLIKLIIPFEPQTPLNICNVYEKFYQGTENANIQKIQFKPSKPVENTQSKLISPSTFHPSNKSVDINHMNIDLENKNNMEKLFCFIWVLGDVLVIGILVVGYKSLKEIVRASIKDIKIRHKEIFNDCMNCMNIGSEVEIAYCKKISSPSLCGIIKPKILIPVSIVDNICDEEFKHIIMHELCHFKSKDMFINWIITLLSVIYWFNPILLYGFHKMRQDCEVVCDSKVISYLDKGENIKYGNTIIRILELGGTSNRIVGTTPMVMNSSEIRRRIIMISKYKKISIKSILLGVLFTAIIGGVGLGVNTSKASSNKSITKSAVNNISKDTTKATVPFSSDIVIYNSHADESYSSGMKVTDVSTSINDKLVKEGLKSRFIKCEPPVEYIKSYQATRDEITKNIKNYTNTVLLDIHRDVVETNNSDTKEIMFVLAKESPYYESNKKFANFLLKEIEKASSNEIKVSIFEYNKGILYFNQDLSNHSLLIEMGNDKSSDSDIEKCTNALVSALKTINISCQTRDEK